MSRVNEINCLNELKEVYLFKRSSALLFDNTSGFIQNALANCSPNPDENDFPDFLFNGGAIEHFIVGSSREGRKGSEFCQKRHSEIIAANQFIEEQKERYKGMPYQPGSYGTALFQTKYEGFSYDDFLRSMKRNISSHIKSLQNCDTKYETVVFLMEQQTARLSIYTNNMFDSFYLLSQDKRALKELAEFAPFVRYLIYYANGVVEAIDLSLLPEMISSAKEFTDIRGGTLNELHLLIAADI